MYSWGQMAGKQSFPAICYTLTMNKLIIIATVSLAILVGSFFAFNSFIYEEKQSDDQTFEPYRASLSGEYICLPNSQEISEEGCMYGIKTEIGELYAIDFALMSQIPTPVSLGEKISGNGVIVPVERLNADYYMKNGISGIFSVTDTLQVLSE